MLIVKILIVRFSSIGDIVLTTPIIAALKNQLQNVEIHYLTKKSFQSILANNPHINKLITINKDSNEVLTLLKDEKYDYIIDLHRNVRTFKLKLKLGVKSYTFPKLNIKKWFLVYFKWRNMPKMHIVERYFEAVKALGVVNKDQNCEYYLSKEDEIDTYETLQIKAKQFIAIAIGAQFATKQFPTSKWIELLEEIDEPVVILGGPMDVDKANAIIQQLPSKNIQSACGQFTLNQSASIVSQARILITNDTGLMHIATCFNTRIVSIWGSTVPELGMYPYYPKNQSLFTIHEVADLSCRPCSKIGFQKCPKGHFDCMMKQDSQAILKEIKEN